MASGKWGGESPGITVFGKTVTALNILPYLVNKVHNARNLKKPSTGNIWTHVYTN